MKLRNTLLIGLIVFGTMTAAFAQSAVDGFKPDVNGLVEDVEIGQARFKYIGGLFSQVNGTARTNLARLNHDGSLDLSFNPAPNGVVGDMVTTFNQVYVVGSFNSIGGAASGGIARLNLNGTNDGTFTASLAGAACIALQADGKVIVGGHFTTVGGTARTYLARFNTDGSLDTSFVPNINNSVFGVAIQPDGKVLINGQFTSVDGQNRFDFARLNSNGSLDTTFGTSWTLAGSNGTTYASAVQPDGKIVVAGDFTRFGDFTTVRNRAVRLMPNGEVDPTFAPSFDGPTFDVEAQPDGKVLIGGGFTTVNGATRGGIARIQMNGAVDTSFVTNTSVVVPAGYRVSSIAVQLDGAVVIGGEFTQVNGSAGYNRVARLYPDGRLDADTVSSIVGGPAVTMVSLPNGQTLLGGGFTSVGGAARQGMARIGWTGGNDSTFANPQLTGWVYGIAVQKNGGYIAGGDFTSAGGTSQAKLARILPTGAVDASFAPTFNAGGYVTSLAIQPDGKIIIAGGFTTVNGVARNRVARLNASGSLDTSFNPNADQPPSVIALQFDGKIMIGGAFENVGGLPRSGIARLLSDGSVDTTFTTSVGGIPIHEVYEITFDHYGYIVIGGRFSTVNGVARSNLARLNGDGTLDTGFVPPTIDGSVLKIIYDLNRSIYVAGRFLNVNGVPSAGVVQLTDAGQVLVFTNAANDVLSMAIRSDNKILLSGYFTTVGGQPRAQFAALRGFFASGSAITADATSIYWFRAAQNVDVLRAEFERSTDGVNYTSIGFGTRGLYGDWVLNTPNADAAGYIRARGYMDDFSVQKSVHEQVAYIQRPAALHAVPFDFDGDGKTDIGIFRPTAGLGEWWINHSSTGQTPVFQFGTSTDKIVPADFTGDGKADVAYFRPSTGEWYVIRSENFTYYSVPFGTNGDIPAPGDFDADGKADYAVFRPSAATWFISQSSGAGTRIFQFGLNGDQPVIADYDGDGKSDVAIFRPGPREWWIDRSTAGVLPMQFGEAGDKIVPGDYTGDGKADVAVWRPSTGYWYIVRSENFTYYGFPFGANGDTPSPGDYDGDGKSDPTVFRPSSATWFIGQTTAGTRIVPFGSNGDKPLPTAFLP